MTLSSYRAHQQDCKPNLIAYRVWFDLGLTVSTVKSKLMVFRKGWFLERSYEWFIDGNNSEVENKYLYRGFTFTTAMNANEAAKRLAIKQRSLYSNCWHPTFSWGKYLDKHFSKYLTRTVSRSSEREPIHLKHLPRPLVTHLAPWQPVITNTSTTPPNHPSRPLPTMLHHTLDT